MDLSFYNKKKVFITGHTGFKGTWLSKVLEMAGAEVYGYSLPPPTSPSLFEILQLEKSMNSTIGDIRDYEKLFDAFKKAQPEIVFHLAAQPLVRASYENPLETYSTNVMGTANILECVRNTNCVGSVINVTTDKVYLNKEIEVGYVEKDILCGFEPYSNSKSCSELVTSSYRQSFLSAKGVAVSTARAGNVIGGGDFAKDRIVPDCIRAAINGREIVVRNPNSTRPYQYVLDAIFAYLLMAQKQWENIELSDCYNVGPDDTDCVTTQKLVSKFCDNWQKVTSRYIREENAVHEAGFLKLNCEKMKNTFNWSPVWDIDNAMEHTVKWTKQWQKGNGIKAAEEEIEEFIKSVKW